MATTRASAQPVVVTALLEMRMSHSRCPRKSLTKRIEAAGTWLLRDNASESFPIDATFSSPLQALEARSGKGINQNKLRISGWPKVTNQRVLMMTPYLEILGLQGWNHLMVSRSRWEGMAALAKHYIWTRLLILALWVKTSRLLGRSKEIHSTLI